MVCDTPPEKKIPKYLNMERCYTDGSPSHSSHPLLQRCILLAFVRGDALVDWSAGTPLPLTDSSGATASSQRRRTLFDCWTWRLLNIDPLQCRQWEARRTVEERVTVSTEIRGCIMLSRFISCFWITLYIRLGCFLGGGDAQNAKEGKLVKFGALFADKPKEQVT